MSHQYTAALLDEELAELDEFLLVASEADECLAIDEAHGYITSLVVCQAPFTEKEWLFSILGEASFSGDDEKNRISGLLLRLSQEITATLEARKAFEPMVIEEESGEEVFEVYEGWCFGFMLGVADQQARWEVIPKVEQDLLAPIATLALLHDDEVEDMDDEDYSSWVELIPGAVAGLYAYWHK